MPPNSFLIAYSYLSSISIFVVDGDPSIFLSLLSVSRLSRVKFPIHNFVVPTNVLSIYFGVSFVVILLSISCLDIFPIHSNIALFIFVTQSKSKKLYCSVIGLGVHFLFNLLFHIAFALSDCS